MAQQAVAQSAPQSVPQPVPLQPGFGTAWWKVLLTGILLFLLGVTVLILSGNPKLIPAVILLGNFTVPVAYVTFFYQRQHLSRLTISDMEKVFVLGGLLGIFASALLEPIFIVRLNFVTAFGVGLIEELVKILGVLIIVRHRPHDSELDGLLLGAAAGMGFAALESTGYTFVAFLQSRGSLSATVGLMLLRGFLSPAGHGTWTAIFASVLFRESRPGHFHINRSVVAAYLGVSVLHGLWDGLPGLLTTLVMPGPDVLLAELILAVVSLLILSRRWREAVRRELGRRLQR
jgi:protease PrsW